MQPDYKLEFKRWFAQAQRDADDANILKNNARYNVACFLYQQAAEKAVKAYLYLQGIEEVWGHSVAELCKKAKKHGKGFDAFVKEGYLLDKFYIPTRYPNGLPGGIPSEAFQEKDAAEASRACSGIIKFVRKKI